MLNKLLSFALLNSVAEKRRRLANLAESKILHSLGKIGDTFDFMGVEFTIFNIHRDKKRMTAVYQDHCGIIRFMSFGLDQIPAIYFSNEIKGDKRCTQ